MSEVEELEARIINLTRQDMARLRDWFLQLDDRLWDQQIASDFKAGRFQGLIDKAREELAEGRAREL
ncbi:MAG: hypothetical protein ACLQGP_15290 [Isosphaeraceae bacterium]